MSNEMQFTKYNSLENHYKEAYINKVVLQGKSEGTWIATEKVHGANFSFWYNPVDGIRTARRSGFIDPLEGAFFSSFKLDKYFPEVINTHQGMVDSGMIQAEDTIVIYGEIFGGDFFGEKVQGSAQVQAGVNYHPGTEFMAFDLKVIDVVTGIETYLAFDTFATVLSERIPMVPVIAIGTFDEVMGTDNEFQSVVPGEFGLEAPADQDNTAEGYVMRPLLVEKHLKNGSRIIIKSKNIKFSEVARGKTGRKKDKDVLKMSEQSQKIFQTFSLYLTENRVNNVISKEGEVQWKDFSRIAGLLMKDAVEEFDGDYPGQTLKSTVGDDWKAFSKFAGATSQEITREVFKKLL